MVGVPATTEQIDSELVLWRVFGVSDVYEDRPLPWWSVEETRGPARTDRLKVYLGDLVEDMTLALRQWKAQIPSLLDLFVGHPITPDDRRSRYEQELSSVVLSEFDEPYPLWLTLRLTRPYCATAVPDAVTGWVAADYKALTAMSTFEEEGNRYLDGVVAHILGAMWPVTLGQLRYAGRRAFLTAPGRAAFMRPELTATIKDSGVSVARGAGWASAPTGPVADAVRSMPSGRSFEGRISGPAQWFIAALAEEDDVRRFVFAFAGLELLATKAEKRARPALIERITATDTTLPVEQLLWPSTDKDRVWRNLIFRFAAMAWVYSPITAIDDVEACRELATARNDLFHGVEGGAIRDQSIRCRELLGRYISLIAAEGAS